MNRPYTDISLSKISEPIKNGTIVALTTPLGYHQKYNRYTKEFPTLEDIDNKYGNKFYNGIFVQLAGGQTIVGA